MQTEEDPELTIEVDADGFRVDHRSETEQSSQSKEVHEYPDRTEIRLRDEKEVRLEEVKTRETTRRATYDDIIALLDAQLEGLDEIQTSREVTIQEFNRVETTRETVTDGELKREIRTTDEKRKEEILEGPSNTTRVVTTETETLVVQPSPGALSLTETESPLSQISDNAESSSEHPHGIVIDSGLRTEPVRGGFNVGITPGEADFRIRSEGVGGKTLEKSEGGVVWVPKHSADERGYLGVPGELNLAENTGSLHRIQHRAHRIEELIVEDVDTFYEDQSKPAKRLSGLLGVKRDKRGKSQSPSSTLEKRPKTEATKGSAIKEERMTIEVANVTPVPAPERPAQPSGVDIISAVPRTDIVIQPDIQVESSLGVRPRDVVVDPQDGNTNRITYVVSYDSPGGVNIRDSGKRKKDVHPKKKKDKRRLGKQQSETEHVMPAETEFVTYVVNYDRTEPLDGDNKSPRPTVFARPEGSFQEPSISKQPRDTGNATIEVDMNAGDVKVMEPIKVLDERQGASKTFVVNYEVPEVEKSTRPSKPKKELKEVRVPHAGRRQPPSDEFTYIVNYDQPSVTPIVPPTAIGTTVESPDIDSDLEKKAPVYSITVVEPGPGVFVEKARKSPEKLTKKQDGGNKDGIELTYIVNYDEPRQGSLDDTDNFPRKDGGGDVWIRPPKPTFEAKVRGKEEIKAKPAKHVPGNTEPLTFVVEYERGGAEEKAKGGIPVPKLKKGGSSDNVVEKMYTYIVNYDQPSSRLGKKQKKTKKEDKKGKAVKAPLKAEGPHLQKSYDIERPSPELSFTVQHPFPEPVTQPKKPTSELSIEVRHPVPEPAFEIREESPEYSITIDHPFPEPFTKPQGRFEEFSIAVDHQFPEPVTNPEGRFEEFSIAVDHPFPEPVTKPEGRFEEFSIAVDHPFPEPVTKPQGRFEEFSIAVDHPFPEPVTKPEGRFEEFSIAVDHPFPEPATQPDEQFEEFFFAVDHPFPEPATPPEEQFEEFFNAVDQPFPEPVTKPQEQFEEFSITVDHPIPEAHLEIKEPVLPHPKLPKLVPSKDSGESLTYVVTYNTPTVSREAKPTKTEKKRKPLFSKGSKPPIKDKVATEATQEVAQTFTYIVNYDEPSIRPKHRDVPKPAKAELFGKVDVKASKPETETSAKIPGPKETVGQSEALSITVSQPTPTISRAIPDIAPSESAEGVTYIVNYDEPFSVGLVGEKQKKIPRKKAEMKKTKPAEPEYQIGVLPEESAMPQPASSLTIVVEHPEPKAALVTGDIPSKVSSTAETLTYVVNYDQPIGEKEKVRDVKGKHGWQKDIEGKKPWAAVEADTRKVVVKTPEPAIIITPVVPKPPSVNESISFTVVHDQPELPEARSAIVTDSQWKPESSEERTFIVNYNLPSKTEQDVEAPEIEFEAPATIEISQSTEYVSPDLKDIEPPSPTIAELQRDISGNIESPAIPVPALTIPKTAGESVTYIVQYEEPLVKTIGSGKPAKEKRQTKGRTFPKKKQSAGADVEIEGAPLPTTRYEVTVTTDQPKSTVPAEVPKRKPLEALTTTPVVAMPKQIDVATEQVTYVVNYDRSHKVILIPEVRDSAAIEVEAEDIPQIEPFEIPEPEVEIEEPNSRLTITVEEPLPDVSAEIEPPSSEIVFKVKEPVAPVITIPDVAFPKAGTAETITYVVTHEEPAPKISGKVKPDKKEKKRGLAFPGKKYSKDIKAGASFEANRPEAAAEVAGGFPLYEVTVKTEQQEPSVDVKKKKREVPVTTPEAVISITKPSGDVDVQAQTQPQSIIYVVNYDESQKVVAKPKIKETANIKEKAIAAVKPSKAPKGKLSSGDGESITYVVTYDDEGKSVPPPKIKGLEVLKVEVQDIHEIKAPEIPQATLDIEEPSLELTITVEQPLPEISAEVKPPTPKIKVKEPFEVEEFTITVDQTLPEVSTEVKLPTSELKVKKPTEVEQLTITVEQPLPEVSTEVKHPTPELKVKMPAKAVVTPPSVDLPQADTLQTFTYVVTHDESAFKISGENKPEKQRKKQKGFSFPGKKISKEPRVEGPSLSDVESLTYVVTYDDSGNVSPPKIKEHAEIKIKTKDIPPVVPPEIPEAEVKLEEPRSQLTISVEHPLPEVGADVKAATPETKIKGPPEFVVKPPSVVIPKAGAAETITYIVTHEEPAFKTTVEVESEKREKKKRGLVFPGTKLSKDVKAGAGVTAEEGPEVNAELAEGVPVYEVSVTTEQLEPAVHAKKKKKKQPFQLNVTTSESDVSITKPSADIAANAQLQSQSVTYVVTYDDTEKAIPPPSKKNQAIVEAKTEDVSKITIPTIPEPKLEFKEPSSQLTITVEQLLPEIAADIKTPTPKIKESSEVERLTITDEQPTPVIGVDVQQPALDINIREPSDVEQLEITVEQPFPEKVKPQIPELKVKQPSEVVVGPPASELTKGGTAETITYIVNHEEVVEPDKKKIRFPGKHFGKTSKIGAEAKEPEMSDVKTGKEKPQPLAKVKATKPAIYLSPGEVLTYVVTYDDSSTVVPTTEIKAPAIPESKFKAEEPNSQLTITVEQPITEISTEVKPPTPEIKIREPPEVEQLTITVEQPVLEISAEVKPPTPDVKMKDPSEVEQLKITVEQPLTEISAEVKPPNPKAKAKAPSKIAGKPPSVDLPKAGTTETITYIINNEEPTVKVSDEVKPETKEKKKNIRFPAMHFGKTYKYEVSGEGRNESDSDVKRKEDKSKSKVNIKAKKPAIDLSPGEVVTYVVTYDDLSKVVPTTELKAPEIPESRFKAEEPNSQLTITVEQPITEISAEVKPPTPEIKIREPFGVEQLSITLEQPAPEISAEVKPPTPEIKIKAPSEVEQLRITVEQPLPQVSAEEKLTTPETKFKAPSEIAVKPPLDLLKAGTTETITYVVNHEEPTVKVSGEVKPEKKEKKIRFPAMHFGKTHKYKVSGEGGNESEDYDVKRREQKPKPQANIKAKKPAIDLSPGEIVTYVVTYDDSSKVAPTTEIKAPEIPESRFKVDEPNSQLTITIEQPITEISAEDKPPTPEIKIREPFGVEQLSITVEQPVPEISAEVKPPSPEIKIRELPGVEQLSIAVEHPVPEISAGVKPPTPEIKIRELPGVEQLTITVEQPVPEVNAEVKPPSPEIKIKGPSEVEQLRITVEQPLPEISAEAKLPTPEAKVKAPSKIAVKPPSVVLPKAGTTETITYIVNNERPAVKVSGEVKPEKKEKKIRFPAMHFGKTHKYKVSGEGGNESEDYDVKRREQKPKPQANIKAKKPAIDLSPGEVVTYVVTYDDSSKVAPTTEIKAPEIPESRFKVDEPNSQLTITIEQPITEISAEDKPPTPEIKIREPFGVEQLSITVEQPVPEISAEVKPPSPEIKIRELPGVEQLSITVEHPVPEISAEVKPPTPEIKIRELPGVEQLTITVEQPVPEVNAEVKPPSPEIKIKGPSEVEQLRITVEQPLPEISAEAKLPTPEAKVKAPSKIAVKPPSVVLPKAGTTETITYIVNNEGPTVKVSGEVKPEKREKKQLGIRVPGKKVTKELKADAGIAAKGPTADVIGEVPMYEVTVTTEQPTLPVAAVSGTKDAVAQKDAVETVTYVVEREEEPHPRETISAEGRKKRRDWIWRVKKPAKSIDISSESQEREAVRIEHESGMSAKIGEPKLGISAETEAPKRDISISTEKANVAQEVSQSPGVPETHTYVVTYNEPQATTSKGKLKLWPFSRKAKPGKLDVKPKPMKNKWTPFKKKQLKVVKPRVDVELSEMKSRDITVGEAVEGDIDVNVPSAPSIALEQKETIAGDVSRTVEMPAAPEFSITIFREEEPPAESVIAPHPSLIIPEAGETDLETREAQKPTDFSQLKFDVEAKLPGRKEQVLAEKVISGKVKVADAEAERTEPKDKDRTVIAGGRREEENAEEETVVYIVNYEQPFGTLTKTKDGAKEAPGGLKPSSETEVAVDKQPDVTNIKHSVQVQMPQLEQCILVPIRDEGSPEDSFYGTEAPVPDWPPIDEPHFEEDIRPDVGRKFETSAVDEKQLPPHLVVVAVDFGTTFSGYAFSFSRDSAGSIHVMRKWEGGDPGAVDHKTPTILLLTPGGQFHSFGFTARDFYHDLSPKEAARWLYFEKFKMALHFNDELNTDTKLAAANGHCVPAIDVFTHALRFFRKHVLQEISDQVSTDVLNEDIYWIITVPAIWTEEAKQFMRLAAYRAGIASPKYPDQLLISLEPEAASIYVRKQRLHQLVPEVPFQRRRSSSRRSMTPEPTAVNQPIVASERKVLPSDSGQLVRKTTTVTVSWPVVTTIPQTDITVGHQVDTAGTRYMVVDCGGGTVDITVHEIQSRDGTLRELHRATGGPFGSVAVDQEFEKLLVEIFGVDFINVFKAKRPAGWVDLLMAFESRKRAANPYITKPLNVSLPFSFIDYHKKYRNCPVEHAIRKYGNRDIRWSSQGMLRLMPDAMNRLFLPAIDKIKEAIGNLLNDSDVKGLRFLFLVGGFADSPMLQMAIRQEFGHLLKIIIPNDASISILKGAVCFGLDPTVITTRKSRMTYGVGVLNRFVHGQHPPSKLVLKDGEEWCTDVFDALVYADQSVAIGDTVLRRYTLVPGDADDVTVSKVVNIYSSDRRNVEYVSERGVTRCGTLCLTDDDGGKRPSASRQDKNDREVQVRMTFGHTEIKVTAFELGTRKSVRATIDFLNK